uniref:Uncharacterized protein n=1 Tax=Talaromyces marneffei PM1 TaxID=1077442 RepID=A0A093VEQ1_TALMA
MDMDRALPQSRGYQIECGTAASHKGGDFDGTSGRMVY